MFVGIRPLIDLSVLAAINYSDRLMDNVKEQAHWNNTQNTVGTNVKIFALKAFQLIAALAYLPLKVLMLPEPCLSPLFGVFLNPPLQKNYLGIFSLSIVGVYFITTQARCAVTLFLAVGSFAEHFFRSLLAYGTATLPISSKAIDWTSRAIIQFENLSPLALFAVWITSVALLFFGLYLRSKESEFIGVPADDGKDPFCNRPYLPLPPPHPPIKNPSFKADPHSMNECEYINSLSGADRIVYLSKL